MRGRRSRRAWHRGPSPGIRRRGGRLLPRAPDTAPEVRLPDDHVALHLLVESRAEVGAVVGVDALLLRFEGDRLRLPGVHNDVDVVVEEAEPVQLVGRLLDVGEGDRDLVPVLDLEVGGGEGRAHRDHLHQHLVAVPGDAGVLDVPDRVGVLVLLLRVDLDRLHLVGLDDLGVVGLGLGEEVEDELHLLLGDVHELRGLRLRRADVEVAPVGELVEAHQPLAVGAHGVALGRGQVADRVGHRHLVHDLPGPELPLGDRAVHEERGVGVAVRPELGVQRPEADRHLGVLDRLVLQDRDAVLVAGEVLVPDGGLDLLPVEGGGDALELAGADDVLAVGGDVDAVRGLAAGHEVDEAGVLGGVDDLDRPRSSAPSPFAASCSAIFQSTAAM